MEGTQFDERLIGSELYFGSLMVSAVPMTDAEFAQKYEPYDFPDDQEPVDGYLINFIGHGTVYWLPGMVFDRCFRKVTAVEKDKIARI